jgi:Copper amine oxidase N-terminal domain.
MKLRWILAGLVAASLAFHSTSLQATAASPPYSLTVDGLKLNSPLSPEFRNGVTFVPMRAIFETLSAKVAFNGKSKQVVGQRGDKSITLTLGSKTAYVNKTAVSLQLAPLTLNNNVYVPLRFVSESLGAEVELNAASKTINIRTVEMDLTVTDKLPLLNDKGESILLKHQGNVKLKWSFQDESPFQNYEGFVGDNHTLVFMGHRDYFVTDFEGNELTTEVFEDVSYAEIEAVKRSDGYDIKASKGDNNYSWSHIPLYTKTNVSPQLIIAGEPSYDYLVVNGNIDSDGHLILLTKDGLAAYDDKGERLWAKQQFQTETGVLSAFEEDMQLVTDSSNNIYLQNEAGYAILNAKGETLLADNGYFVPTILKDGTLLFNGRVYKVENGKLTEAASPYGGGGRGAYSSLDSENTLKKLDPATGETVWTYKQSQMEKQRGYSLFASTLVADGMGNAYISTTGGTIHSLDSQGNLRFILVIDNQTITGTQIIPLSPTTFVAIDNNLVMCFEIANG